MVCSECGDPLSPRKLITHPGAGDSAHPGIGGAGEAEGKNRGKDQDEGQDKGNDPPPRRVRSLAPNHIKACFVISCLRQG